MPALSDSQRAADLKKVHTLDFAAALTTGSGDTVEGFLSEEEELVDSAADGAVFPVTVITLRSATRYAPGTIIVGTGESGEGNRWKVTAVSAREGAFSHKLTEGSE